MIIPNYPVLSGPHDANFKATGTFFIKDFAIINGTYIVTNSIVFLKNGLIHNDDSDAGALIHSPSNRVSFYKDGFLHRVGKPAIIEATESIIQDSLGNYNISPKSNVLSEGWLENGDYHRLCGHAQVDYLYPESNIYYVRGLSYSYEEFSKHPEVIAYNNKLNLIKSMNEEFGE